MKKVFALSILMLLCSLGINCYSQEKESPFSVYTEISSKYLWRGIEMSATPTVFPGMSFTKGNFSFYLDGSYTLNGDFSEVCFAADYSIGAFTIELADFYTCSLPYMEDGFSNFRLDETGHILELGLYYEPENLPIFAYVGTTFFGDDYVEDYRAFSTYAQLGAYHSFDEDNTLSFAMRVSNKSMYNNYEKNISIVDLDLSYETAIGIGENFSMPFKTSFIYCPVIDKAFIIGSLTIEL